MSNRTLLILTIVVIIGMGVILALNVMPVFFQQEPAKYVAQSAVRGSAAVSKGAFYTLNFDQQNHLIEALNGSTPYEKSEQTKNDPSFPIEKIFLYLFDGKEVEITLIGQENNQLVFSIPDWEEKDFLKDNTKGTLRKILLGAIDPPQLK